MYLQSRELTVIFVLGVCGLTIYLLSHKTETNQVRRFPAKPGENARKILVTGTAGFIGHHVAKTLTTKPRTKVVGLDNFNDYYDVKLKMDRGYELSLLGVELYHEDLCTTDLLEDLFDEHNFTHVVHLAAQAGVRYSLENPLAYVHSNVECQMTLMDVLKEKPHVKLIYASSSSVYGKESPIPFRISAPTDKPGNMYAATKKTDELLALHYCLNYNMSAVGLRFFTVYGPFGRPDMAVYKFADSIVNGKELPLFQQNEDAPLERDFTYVDDIVEGVINSLDYEPVTCGERFNLGFGNPLSVPKLISLLEKEFAIKAKIKILPIPPTEILRTWADISTSSELLNFKPKICLEEGVKRFVAWYKSYRKERAEKDMTGKVTQVQLWFKRLLEDRFTRNERYLREEGKRSIKRHEIYQQHEREKYLEWAQSHAGSDTSLEKTFSFYKGMDSIGGDIFKLPHLKDNIKALEKTCQELEKCIGFNSNGVLKMSIKMKDMWESVSNFDAPLQGLYVANIDVCKRKLDDCAINSECVPQMPAQFTCKCRSSYVKNGPDCIPRYGLLSRKELEKEYFIDYFNIFNISDMKHNKELYYFRGYDSPGGDYMLADQYKDDLNKLQEICRKDPICIGVNTNGSMKRRIGSKTTWRKWTDDPKKGIFIFDIDYCLFDDQGCPKDAKCVRLGPADYRCQCNEGSFMRNNICFKTPPLNEALIPKDLPINLAPQPDILRQSQMKGVTANHQLEHQQIQT